MTRIIEEVVERVQRLLLIPECSNKGYKILPIPDELWKKVSSEVCYICESKLALPHHVVPDGESVEDNLVPLCNSCHLWVHRLISRYKGYRKALSYGFGPYG